MGVGVNVSVSVSVFASVAKETSGAGGKRGKLSCGNC